MILNVIFHLGLVIGAAEDVEKAVADLIAHPHWTEQRVDWERVATDLAGLAGAGLLPLPGISQSDVERAIAAIREVL